MTTPAAGFSLGLALRAFWPPLLAWAAATAALVALGWPPLLCATPLSWGLALYCGWAARGRWAEAGVAGAALGLAQGLLFGALSVLLSPGDPAETTSALVRGLGIGLGGVAGGATLALLAAAWSRRAG